MGSHSGVTTNSIQHQDKHSGANQGLRSFAATSRDLIDKRIRNQQDVENLLRKIAVITRVYGDSSVSIHPSPMGGWSVSISSDAEQKIRQFITGEIESIDEIPEEMLRPTKLFYDQKEVLTADEDHVLAATSHE
ncbi:MAG: hypothetical protein KDD56_08740, partial [Bdellovibrionales bacterium]|nr:hypothetical protein [Bdellovibrionales bacterium]